MAVKRGLANGFSAITFITTAEVFLLLRGHPRGRWEGRVASLCELDEGLRREKNTVLFTYKKDRKPNLINRKYCVDSVVFFYSTCSTLNLGKMARIN